MYGQSNESDPLAPPWGTKGVARVISSISSGAAPAAPSNLSRMARAGSPGSGTATTDRAASGATRCGTSPRAQPPGSHGPSAARRISAVTWPLQALPSCLTAPTSISANGVGSPNSTTTTPPVPGRRAVRPSGRCTVETSPSARRGASSRASSAPAVALAARSVVSGAIRLPSMKSQSAS